MKIVHTRTDGGVSITILAKKMTRDEVEEHARILDNREGFVSSRIITDDSLLPSDREFRNAWTDDNPTETVDIDIFKAQEIKKNIFRGLRKPLLEKLDIQFMQALEKGDDTAEIITAKQELRDVTDVELPTNIEDLKTFIPKCLKK